ncbi:hypothetical protein [Actinopolymorpha pittospori]|uniref:Uncharacterized protein n=1 Tax=Actinopolymorpha pittospori TaxID=648752 RepID=A0A927MTI7_9ACTN|nr:hypothetical protein [Actinopolymorpha pittospori]MBE1606056.1 hypothetical protein [Actinopolymorpha pittospori]
MTRRLFALEHYDRTGGESVPEMGPLAGTPGLRLVGAVHLPADDVVLALVEGSDAETVAAAAAAAGWRVDRLTPAAWLAPWEPRAGDTETTDRGPGVPGRTKHKGEEPCDA